LINVKESGKCSVCTSIVSNKEQTIVGWNLDILNMPYRISASAERVTIDISDPKEGWMPLFGANARGDFVSMPTCWPFDARSDPPSENCRNIIRLNMDLLSGKRTFEEIRDIAQRESIYSIPGTTFQAQLSNCRGDVLQIVPGQGIQYKVRPEYSLMTNFSPFKGNREKHPWMGWDRYERVKAILENCETTFGVLECFEALKAASQEECPTVVSMVFEPEANMVYWCENRNWDEMYCQELKS